MFKTQFTRAFGFKQIALEQKNVTLNDQPVALPHADLPFNLKRRPLPLALRYCLQRSIAVEAFDRVKLPAVNQPPNPGIQIA